MATSERAAFDELVRAQAPRLLRAAYLLTGDSRAAEDLVQTALTKAHLARARVMSADSPEAYLRRILVNAHRRSFRRRRVAEHLTADVPEGYVSAADLDLRRDVVAAVMTLPRRQRAVVVLRYLEDRPEAEVASILGCARGTVKSQASRALATLRDHPALTSQVPATKERP